MTSSYDVMDRNSDVTVSKGSFLPDTGGTVRKHIKNTRIMKGIERKKNTKFLEKKHKSHRFLYIFSLSSNNVGIKMYELQHIL